MILDYSHPVDFSSNSSLRRFRRWLSFKLANYIACIEDKKETDKYFANPDARPLGCDYREASKNIELVRHYHYAITLILNHTKNEGNRRSNQETDRAES